MIRTRSLVAAAALALLAVSCSSSAGSSGSSGSSGLFKWGTTSPIDSLNPFVAVQQNAYYTFEYVYPFLVQYGPGLRVVPDFAKSWQVTNGGRTITFTTRTRHGPSTPWSSTRRARPPARPGPSPT
jgi:peptide/nickel transport system substrate-binding protein